MEVKSYRARSLQEALRLVRQDLGPGAAVLHTREVSPGWFGWIGGARQIEVTASTEVHVPSHFAEPETEEFPPLGHADFGEMELGDELPIDSDESRQPPAHEHDFRAQFRNDLKGQIADLQSMVEDLCLQSEASREHELPESLFHLFTDLIDAEVSEDLARELVERIRAGSSRSDLDDPVLLKARMARLIEEEIVCCGPIEVTPGQRRLVVLVGPTGVGKTTTIAKLAANFHLRDRYRVGLITVDTYRIAAVDQLRTYADIIDLPMEVVVTPRDMRAALARLQDFDLVLMDTAGRSPRDEVKIQELKTMLAEARADEVHLVLSSVASTASMKRSAERFAEVGATALVLTKLDEATGLGNLLPLVRTCRLPLSYVTNGQNVPDDISASDRRQLARIVLGMEACR
ncbi:MAG: flagellar biosynthesis protein FlhF [Pirellulaceae bacterium]